MSDEARVVSYRFTSAAFAGEDLPVGHVRLVEALSEPYLLRVAVASRDPDAPLETMLGKDVTLDIARHAGRTRRVCGIAREVTEGERAGLAPIAELEVVPALSYLALTRTTRIFQDTAVPAILKKVLGDGLAPYGRSVTFDLRGTYEPREYCVQYQESDLDFVHRLMEEEGIGYAFDHEGDVEMLVLCDRNAAYEALGNRGRVPYRPQNMEIEREEPVVRFERLSRPRTSRVVTRDWDWTRGGAMSLEAAQDGQGADGRTRESYEHGRGRSLTLSSYDQGVRKYQKQDSSAQAPLRAQQHAFDAVAGQAISRVVTAEPGRRFELSGHPTLGMDDHYLITRVEHVSDPVGAIIEGGGSTDPYYNRIECIPVDVEYKPERRTPKPRIASVQTAVVTGPSGEEIHVDEHGRIRLQFHWDREGPSNEKSTCWVRVQQPWAGPGWGFWWVPRIGMEVVVHFVDGDPDRPLATAAVYNGTNPTPYALPDEKTKSTIKSNSSLGGGGFNEFRFEDKAGDEEIYTHAQKDYNEVVENDHTTLVHHDQSNVVDNDQTQLIKNDQTETVHANQVMTVGNDRTVIVHGDFDETVDGTETRHTVGDVTESFDANETRSITGDVTETIGGNETRTVGANQDETIAADHSVTITGSSTEDVVGSWTRTVTGGISTTTPAAFSITAAGGVTMTAAAGIEFIAPGGMQMVAAGGVTRVDSEWNWLGGMDVKLGVTSLGIVVSKRSVTGAVIAIIGAKIEDSGASFGIKGADLGILNAKMGLKTIKLMTMTAANLQSHFEIDA